MASAYIIMLINIVVAWVFMGWGRLGAAHLSGEQLATADGRGAQPGDGAPGSASLADHLARLSRNPSPRSSGDPGQIRAGWGSRLVWQDFPGAQPGGSDDTHRHVGFGDR
jgi:hypothetical protein